jgi:hypothetical protein
LCARASSETAGDLRFDDGKLALIGSRREADILRRASAAVVDGSGLKNVSSGSNLGMSEASISRFSGKTKRIRSAHID